MTNQPYRVANSFRSLLAELQDWFQVRFGFKPTQSNILSAANKSIEDAGGYERVDWWKISEIDKTYSGLSSYKSRQESTTVLLNLEPPVLEAIEQIQDITSHEKRFEWKRKGGVYKGVAMRYMLLAYKMILDDEAAEILKDAPKTQELKAFEITEDELHDHVRKAPDGKKVLDWEKAAEIVRGTQEDVFAGLAEDWDNTGGLIGSDGRQQRNDEDAYVISVWATPVVAIGSESNEGIECWKYAGDDSSSRYPDWWGNE